MRERGINGSTYCAEGHKHLSTTFDRHGIAHDEAVEALLTKCDMARANGDPGKYIAGLSVADAHFAARLIRELRK